MQRPLTRPRILVALAIVVLALGAYLEHERLSARSAAFRRQSAQFAALATHYQALQARELADACSHDDAAHQELAARLGSRAEVAVLMERRFAYAASHPWLYVPADVRIWPTSLLWTARPAGP